jgi:hypothetical protein
MNEGKPLGDHYPLMVTFEASSKIATAINDVAQDGQQNNDAPAYTIQGTTATSNQKGIIIKEGRKYYK